MAKNIHHEEQTHKYLCLVRQQPSSKIKCGTRSLHRITRHVETHAYMLHTHKKKFTRILSDAWRWYNFQLNVFCIIIIGRLGRLRGIVSKIYSRFIYVFVCVCGTFVSKTWHKDTTPFLFLDSDISTSWWWSNIIYFILF